MSKDILRILRYNTGNDKKVFLKFKDYFDVALINANIVSYSKAAIADLISIHKKEYIIDPQTHIFMHDPVDFSASNGEIKKSVKKFIEMMPEEIKHIILNQKRALVPNDINTSIIEKLNQCIYDFQTKSVALNLAEKEYGKYLTYLKIKTVPKYVIAPYFMIKDDDNYDRKSKWLKINQACIQNFVQKFANNDQNIIIAIQLVIGKKNLLDQTIFDLIKQTYNLLGYEYVFLWIDNFYTFTASKNENIAFKKLVLFFNSINKKVVVSYGGYDAILLCHEASVCKLYGVAQSAGYGEYRKVTPVGGGIPANKFYFLPIHYRMNIDEAVKLLIDQGYFNNKLTQEQKTKLYFEKICDCQQCKSIIKNDINNFELYAEANPFIIKTKNGSFQRNKPTTDAKLMSDIHFMYCKKTEWMAIENHNLTDLIQTFKKNNDEFHFFKENQLKDWIDIFGK